MEFKNILVDLEEPLAVVTINRPKKLNALNTATIKELHLALKALEKNRQIRVIIITGSEEKAFVAGADISEFSNFSVKQGGQLAAQGQELLFSFIENLNKPVIAAINGFALGRRVGIGYGLSFSGCQS